MPLNCNTLVSACYAVRIAAQKVSDEGILFHFQPFPRGWCGCVSRVLGAFLVEKYPEEKFDYVCGRRNGTHAWIEHNGIVLDITADQFEDCNEPIIVKPYKESFFHQTFEIEYRYPCQGENKREYEERTIYEKISK